MSDEKDFVELLTELHNDIKLTEKSVNEKLAEFAANIAIMDNAFLFLEEQRVRAEETHSFINNETQNKLNGYIMKAEKINKKLEYNLSVQNKKPKKKSWFFGL